MLSELSKRLSRPAWRWIFRGYVRYPYPASLSARASHGGTASPSSRNDEN